MRRLPELGRRGLLTVRVEDFFDAATVNFRFVWKMEFDASGIISAHVRGYKRETLPIVFVKLRCRVLSRHSRALACTSLRQVVPSEVAAIAAVLSFHFVSCVPFAGGVVE